MNNANDGGCKDSCRMILQQIGYQEKTNSLSMSCDIYCIYGALKPSTAYSRANPSPAET